MLIVMNSFSNFANPKTHTYAKCGNLPEMVYPVIERFLCAKH